jgi:restriction system protein
MGAFAAKCGAMVWKERSESSILRASLHRVHPDMAIMAKRSLFAILSRSPWWLSVLIAAAVFMAVRQFMPDYAALASTLPFLGIAGYAGWRQSRLPSAERVTEMLVALRAMSWQEFAAIMDAAFRSEGYAVVALTRGAADFELRKSGRVALAACKRWKVAQTGIEPLRELVLAKETAGAQECIYVAAGDVSLNAREFAAQNKIRLLCEVELVQFLARSKSWKSKVTP